jgi:muconolactone delta-isomerase
MLFLVSMTVQIQHDVEPKRITRLTALEHEKRVNIRR